MADSNINNVAEDLLSSESRYLLHLNTVEYEGHQMYDIPYPVSAPTSQEDQFLSILSQYKNRLDKISYDYLANSKLWWALASVNNIDNPFELELDSIVRIPPSSQLVMEGVIQ